MQKYQLKIALCNSKPPIWRRVIINPDLTLQELHKVIQTVMPWTDSHLYQFEQYDEIYSGPDSFDQDDSDENELETVKVNELLQEEKDKLEYLYDFGDSWEHRITLEKIVEMPDDTPRAVFVTGRGECPPEDCGGISGYYYMLKVLSDPKQEEFHTMCAYMGLDPEDITEADYNPKMSLDRDYITKTLNEI